MKNLAGKVALVTGGSSGLGEATAIRFAEQGAQVVIAARRVDQSEAVVARIVAAGGVSHFVATDVANSTDIERMVATTLEKFGRLDYAVNNAGIAGPRLTMLADVTEEQWDAVMDVNLRGVWLCMKAEIRAMLGGAQASECAIVNVASIYGSKPSDMGHSTYATSKHAVVGLTQSAAVDYGQSGPRINAIAPGFTLSEMVDPKRPGAAERYETLVSRHSGMRRLGRPEEIAAGIVWLCSPEASYVNGAVLTVDGGGATRLY